jgi:hypothetical protein
MLWLNAQLVAAHTSYIKQVSELVFEANRYEVTMAKDRWKNENEARNV